MAHQWDEWIAPWTKEQCELRYVEGERITIEQLAIAAGIPAPTIRRWAAAGKWRTRRDAFQATVREETRDKLADKLSDELGDLLSGASVEHLEAYRICRRLAMMRGQFLLRKIEPAFRTSTHPEMAGDGEADPLAAEAVQAIQAEALQSLNPMELNLVCLIIDRCVRGERLVAGLDYENVNAAIAACEKAGLEVKVPIGAVLASFGGAQGEASVGRKGISDRAGSAV
jgi:hypothetical protein